jgi:chorismate-pyruvate lyase
MKASTLAPIPRPQAGSDLYPLELLYALRGQALPAIETVPAQAMPASSRSLLAHESDMTSTLESFYGERLHVDVLGRRIAGREYFREVLLRLGARGRAVEYGAIRIMLDILPEDVRREILRERQPFGRILTEWGVAFSSRPQAYLRIASDDFINRALDLDGPQWLFGRRNRLLDAWERPLAEIVEILPPS